MPLRSIHPSCTAYSLQPILAVQARGRYPPDQKETEPREPTQTWGEQAPGVLNQEPSYCEAATLTIKYSCRTKASGVFGFFCPSRTDAAAVIWFKHSKIITPIILLRLFSHLTASHAEAESAVASGLMAPDLLPVPSTLVALPHR